MPKDDIFNEIDEIKQLLDNDTEGENLSLSVEDILAEYQYEKTVAPAASRKEKPGKTQRDGDLREEEARGKPEQVPQTGTEESAVAASVHVAEKEAEPVPAPKPQAPEEKPQKKSRKTEKIINTPVPENTIDREELERELAAFEEEKTLAGRKKFDLIFGEQELEQPQEPALPARPGWLDKLRAPEQQPEEMPVRQALPDIAKQARGLGWRTFSAFWLCLALVYLTFASKAGWPLPPMLSYITAPYIYLLAVSLGQLGVMLLGADVMAKGARDIIGLRPGLEALVTVSAAAAIAYVMGVIIRPDLGGYLPYCIVAAFSVWLCMLGSYLRLSALRWSCRLAVSAEQPYTVVREEAVWELRSAYIKSAPDNTGGFIAQSRLPDCVERFMRFFAPLAIIASFVFALLASRNESVRFLWAFSAVISPAAGSFALCAALPYFMAAKKLFPVGAALAGWKAASELSDDSVMVLTDGDLFPPGTVTLSGLKVFNNYPTETVIACAASLMEASGSGLARIFRELVHNRSDVLRKAEQFQYYEGGGMGCEIAGNAVLMGTQNFMLRMGVRLPEGVSLRDAVYLSLNHDLAGVFAVGYTSSAGVRDGFAALMSRKVTLIIAARDFNITPAMLREKMSANINYAEFPVIEERLDLSRQDRWVAAPPAAVIVREGLVPFAESVMTARRFHRIALVNLVLGVIGAAAGILIMYYLSYTGSFSAAAPGNLFLYSALWTVPAVMLSGWVGAG